MPADCSRGEVQRRQRCGLQLLKVAPAQCTNIEIKFLTLLKFHGLTIYEFSSLLKQR